MTSPVPEDFSPESTLKALVDAFQKLPAVLSYGGLLLVIAFLFLVFAGFIPDILLIIPGGTIIAFLVYAYMDHAFSLRKQREEQAFLLHQQAQQQRHEQEMARLQRESQVESPQLLLSASEPEKKGEEPVADAEWERRYLYHLLALCGHPPSMALVDIKEAGLGGAKLA
ncbi:MAG: hypothetical protein KDE09_20245, partial [Anaerolineales bacterium]|nr:hypothetical protein [Anaerolineales bacterium]